MKLTMKVNPARLDAVLTAIAGLGVETTISSDGDGGNGNDHAPEINNTPVRATRNINTPRRVGNVPRTTYTMAKRRGPGWTVTAIDKRDDLTPAQKTVAKAVLAHQNRHNGGGMTFKQLRETLTAMPPKTIDGSIYTLRHADPVVIVSSNG